MRSVRLRRPASMAAAAALTLALAACNDEEGSAGQGESGPAETASLNVPEQFDSTAPAWEPISDLQGNTSTAISPDGKHYAYAYGTGEGGELRVGQIDLESGERGEEQSVELLSPSSRDSGPDVGLMYSANRLVLIQAGTPEDGAEKQWRASIFSAGRATKPKTLTQELGSTNDAVALPSSSVGPLVEVSTGGQERHYAIDAEGGDMREVPTEPARPLKGCGGQDCDLPLEPVAQVGQSTVATFQESSPGGRTVCSDSLADSSPDEDGFDGCLRGFGTSEWTSQDPNIAPEGAIAKSAHLYAVGSEHVVGAWQAKGGGTIFRTVNVRKPRSAHVEVSCEETSTDGTATHPLSMSPSETFAVAGALLFDVKSGQGRCFEGSDDPDDLAFVSVEDSGTAWGSAEGSAVDTYAREVVRATTDGGLQDAGEQVALPWAFLRVQDQETAVFTNSGQERDGATVLAAYPKK